VGLNTEQFYAIIHSIMTMLLTKDSKMHWWYRGIVGEFASNSVMNTLQLSPPGDSAWRISWLQQIWKWEPHQLRCMLIWTMRRNACG